VESYLNFEDSVNWPSELYEAEDTGGSPLELVEKEIRDFYVLKQSNGNQ
jgi:hypothetical protein